MRYKHLIFLTAFSIAVVDLFAQGDRKDKAPVTYEELYDEPYSVNKFFIGFQPIYGELFSANVNAGYGVEASYYLKDKWDFRVHFRKPYSRKFFDISRDLALNSQETKQKEGKLGYVDNEAEIFNYYEFGATYHVRDFESSSKTKMVLYKNSYKGNRWAARVPLNAEVPCKVRKIYGVRFGGIIWDSSIDLNRVLEKQGLKNEDLISSDGLALPSELPTGEKVDVFTNISSKGLYLGGSMSWIKNVAVSFDKFEEGIDDLMLTAFVDLMYSPSLTLDNIVFTGKEGTPNAGKNTYSVNPVKLSPFGFRAGIDGKFNRTLSWSYGGEVGYRPSIQGRQFYALIKISFPVFGTNLDYKVESFGK